MDVSRRWVNCQAAKQIKSNGRLGHRKMALGILWCKCVKTSSLWQRLLTPAKLGICAIPVFFKLPGVSSNDLGIRTQGNFRIAASVLVLTTLRVCDKQEVVTVWVGYVFALWDTALVLTASRCNGPGIVLLEGSTRPCRLYRSCFGARGYDV